MSGLHRLALSLAALLCFATAALPAPGGGDEDLRALEEKIVTLRRKADELRAAGRTDDAEQMAAEARKYEDKANAVRARRRQEASGDAERDTVKRRIAELQEKAANLKREGRTDEAKAVWRESEELAAKLGGGKPAPAAPDPARGAAELREKARALRERGSTADAEVLEGKAARMDEAAALRRESNELELRAKEAKAAGRADEARDLIERSGRAWRRSEEILSGGAAPKKPEGGSEDLRTRIAKLRDMARDCRAEGKADKAEAMEREAAELERKLAGGSAPAPAGRETDEIRAELERLRRRIAELEEELSKRR